MVSCLLFSLNVFQEKDFWVYRTYELTNKRRFPVFYKPCVNWETVARIYQTRFNLNQLSVFKHYNYYICKVMALCSKGTLRAFITPSFGNCRFKNSTGIPKLNLQKNPTATLLDCPALQLTNSLMGFGLFMW